MEPRCGCLVETVKASPRSQTYTSTSNIHNQLEYTYCAAVGNPFAEADTRAQPFHPLDGGSFDVSMMRTEEEFGYAAGDGYQAVDLPYVGDELSMTVLLPDEGRFREFGESLDASLVNQIIADLGPRYVALDLPRFEFESEFRLGETLRSLGMADAFDSAASDFSGIDGRSCLAEDTECLHIREVVHKAYVSADEAAAATAVMMQGELDRW